MDNNLINNKNLTNNNETRSKHNFANILNLDNKTKKLNEDGDFIVNLDMNSKNIKNIKIDKMNNNSVSTIGYTNEKIGKPGTNIDMQELNSIINLKNIDNSLKDNYVTN